MPSAKTIWKFAGFLLAAFAGGMAGSVLLRPEAPSAGVPAQGSPGVVGTFGVGGVLTWEGELWQYRPDKKQWVTLDESFALEGQATSIVPLPIRPQNIRSMETFGFLVADNDDCWLYDLENRRWTNVGKPPFHDPRR